MTKIIDEDVIRQKPVSDAYRDGWERTFGDKEAPPEPSKDGIECKLVLWMHYCKTCERFTNTPEDHRFHLVFDADHNGNFTVEYTEE